MIPAIQALAASPLIQFMVIVGAVALWVVARSERRG